MKGSSSVLEDDVFFTFIIVTAMMTAEISVMKGGMFPDLLIV